MYISGVQLASCNKLKIVIRPSKEHRVFGSTEIYVLGSNYMVASLCEFTNELTRGGGGEPKNFFFLERQNYVYFI